MINQAAFINREMPMLKVALHTHTTRSDGRHTPRELMLNYASLGYDAVAITDHRIYNFENYAPETGLLLIPGVELDAHFTDGYRIHMLHEVALGRAYQAGVTYEQDQRFSTRKIEQPIEFAPDIEDAHQKGNLTFYCHPGWSGTPVREFEHLPGNFAMEIWNTGCVQDNDLDENNAAFWDDLLSQGRRISAVAVDDCHIPAHEGHGYVMVRAEKTLDDVLDALREARFYASCGPEIHNFCVLDNGNAYIETSPCAMVGFVMDHAPAFLNRGTGVLSHELPIHKGCKYVRGICMDEKGRRAWTNPIYLG